MSDDLPIINSQVDQMPADAADSPQLRAGFDIRVIELPTATATDTVDGSVLHGVSDADKKDYQYPFSQLKTYFQGGLVTGVSSVFGRTGAVTAAEGDYNLDHLGDVSLSSPASNQVLLYNGSGWINSSIPTAAIDVDLGYTAADDGGTVTCSAGDNATIPVVDGTNAGLMTPAQKTKLDGISSGADQNVPTNLGNTPTASNVKVTSSTGDDTTIAAANTTSAGVMTKDQVTKLNGIQTGAQVNVGTNLTYTGHENWGRVNSSTGDNASIPLAVSNGNAGLFTGTEKSKLGGIESGAQVNVGTNLGREPKDSTVVVSSSTGTNTELPAATTTKAGVMTKDMVTKLNGIDAGADVNVPTNLSYTAATTKGTVNSSTGSNADIPLAVNNGNAGLFSGADKKKLDGIADGAGQFVGTNITCNPSTTSVGIESSTGTDGVLLEVTGTRAGVMTTSLYAKLNNLPLIDAGTSVGNRLRWNGSKWAETDLFY